MDFQVKLCFDKTGYFELNNCMKTLREYIDQLDEISRRDFLKGAGATAGIAALGIPNLAKAELSQENWEKILGMMVLYMACKGPYPRELQNGRSVTVPPAVCQQANDLIRKFATSYPNGRAELNKWYNLTYNSMNQVESEVPFKGSVLNRVYFDPAFQQKVIRDFASLLEFYIGKNADNNQAVAEDGNPDAVARILELSKNK